MWALAATAAALAAACGGHPSAPVADRVAAAPPRACPPAAAVFQARFVADPGSVPPARWLLMLGVGSAAGEDGGAPVFTELDAATAAQVHVPPPPAKLWLDGGDGSWCEARPAAMYSVLWEEGSRSVEYGVELDTACTPPTPRQEPLRVAVAGTRPPTGCRAIARPQTLTARTASWHPDANAFEPPTEAPAIAPEVVAALSPAPACASPCMALWTVDALTSHGGPVVWQVERTWVTPNPHDLCDSKAEASFSVLVRRRGAIAAFPLGSGAGEPDVFAALEDDGGVRVLVTSTPGEYATWEVDPQRQQREVRYGIPGDDEGGGDGDLGPHCGP